ncbi:hypothetical protein [Rhodococcus jostii]|uniref:hypothetical protein n=1 Tax=Rhodococcus jostii TaxID=132919 RepID=UPI00363604D0
MTDRMVFPAEQYDVETFRYDVETLVRDAFDTMCQIFGVPTFDDIDVFFASLAVETVLLDAVSSPEQVVEHG